MHTQVTPESEYLILTEGGPPGNYTLWPTVPVLCPTAWNTSQGLCTCELRISVYDSPLYPSDGPRDTCPDDENKPVRQAVIKTTTDPTICGLVILEVRYGVLSF